MTGLTQSRMLEVFRVEDIDRPRFRPVVDALPIDAFMLDVEIRPRAGEVWEPAVGHQSDVGFAHDDLAEHVNAMICVDVLRTPCVCEQLRKDLLTCSLLGTLVCPSS